MEGIPEAVGYVILGGAPLVEVPEIPGILVDLPIQDHRRQRRRPGHRGQRPCGPPPPRASRAGGQQAQQAPSQQHIVGLMREAYVDFSRYGVPGLDVSGYDLYHALEAESYTGDLVTNIFAGGRPTPAAGRTGGEGSAS